MRARSKVVIFVLPQIGEFLPHQRNQRKSSPRSRYMLPSGAK